MVNPTPSFIAKQEQLERLRKDFGNNPTPSLITKQEQLKRLQKNYGNDSTPSIIGKQEQARRIREDFPEGSDDTNWSGSSIGDEDEDFSDLPRQSNIDGPLSTGMTSTQFAHEQQNVPMREIESAPRAPSRQAPPHRQASVAQIPPINTGYHDRAFISGVPSLGRAPALSHVRIPVPGSSIPFATHSSSSGPIMPFRTAVPNNPNSSLSSQQLPSPPSGNDNQHSLKDDNGLSSGSYTPSQTALSSSPEPTRASQQFSLLPSGECNQSTPKNESQPVSVYSSIHDSPLASRFAALSPISPHTRTLRPLLNENVLQSSVNPRPVQLPQLSPRAQKRLLVENLHPNSNLQNTDLRHMSLTLRPMQEPPSIPEEHESQTPHQSPPCPPNFAPRAMPGSLVSPQAPAPSDTPSEPDQGAFTPMPVQMPSKDFHHGLTETQFGWIPDYIQERIREGAVELSELNAVMGYLKEKQEREVERATIKWKESGENVVREHKECMESLVKRELDKKRKRN